MIVRITSKEVDSPVLPLESVARSFRGEEVTLGIVTLPLQPLTPERVAVAGVRARVVESGSTTLKLTTPVKLLMAFPSMSYAWIEVLNVLLIFNNGPTVPKR